MSEQELDPVPWPERLRDWWKCSVCGSRLGHHNSRYEENHKLRTHIKELQEAVNQVRNIINSPVYDLVPAAEKLNQIEGVMQEAQEHALDQEGSRP